jgi:hypothetical protein
MGIDRADDSRNLQVRLNAIKSYLEGKEQKTQQDSANLGNNFFDSSTVSPRPLGSVNPQQSPPKTNAFENLVDLLGHALSNPVHEATSYMKTAALQALAGVMRQFPQIVREEFQNGLFISSRAACGVDTAFPGVEVRLTPTELDMFSMLKVAPDSSLGRTLYEGTSGPFSINRLLYEAFTAPAPTDVGGLFSFRWDGAAGVYVFSNLLNKNIYNTLTDYFLNVPLLEQKNIYGALVTLMSGAVSVERNTQYLQGINLFNRLVSKVFAYCEDENKKSPLVSDNLNVVDDLPFGLQDLFSFDEVEGMASEEEQSRLSGVMQFSDCAGVAITPNPRPISDFMEGFDRPTARGGGSDTHIDNFLNDTAYDAYQQSGGGIPLALLKIAINKNFVKLLPKALAMMVLSPKVLLPYVLVRKALGGATTSVTELLKNAYKVFFKILRRLFEAFLVEFFRLIKRELLRLVTQILEDTLRELGVKRTTIIRSLLSILTRLAAQSDVKSCGGLISTILGLLNPSVHLPFSVPTPLLLAATQRSGFSNVRAFINVVEEMDKAGIYTGDLYGTPNKYLLAQMALITGVEAERSTNGVVNATVVMGTVPTPSGPGVMVPGTIKIVGVIG